MLYMINVVRIKDGVVDEIKAFVGTHEQKVKQTAEEHFFDMCASTFSNWDDYTPKDKEAILENGYEEGNDMAVCITHPDVIALRAKKGR